MQQGYTAKVNKLVVERYLVYLFDNLLKIDIKDNETLYNLMSCSHKMLENMDIRNKK